MPSEFHIDSFKILVIESRFLTAGLTGTNAPPCCVSIASDVLNQTILDWRLFSSTSLAKATVLALDSMFDKASGADPRESRLGHRYRYGSYEYEVTAVQDNCVWLQRRNSRRDATKLDSQETPSPQRKALPNRAFIMRAGAIAKVKERRPSPPKQRRLDRQPEAAQHLILEGVHSSYLLQGLSGRSLASLIVYQIAHLNESRSADQQLKVPSLATMYRLIRELREPSKHSL